MPGRRRDAPQPPRAPRPPGPPPKPHQRPPTVRPAPRRSMRPRIWPRVRAALLVVLALLLVAAGLFYWQVSSVARAIVVPDVRPNPPLASPLVGGMNVLLIGVDERPGHPEEGVRSDTLIVAHLDATGRWASLLSIPRDTQVELPGVGVTKINVAYGQGHTYATELYGPGTSPAQGGMALAAETVEDFLELDRRGMRIHSIAQINFDGFASIIDALGGITVNVPRLIVDDAYPTADFGVTRVEFQPGEQHMDGRTALIYARTRHADSDFGRAERQQQVLRAIAAKVRSRGTLGRVAAMPGLLQSVKGEDGSVPPVLTTMPIARPDMLLGMVLLAGGTDPETIAQVQISPATVGVSEFGSNLVWDPAGVQAQVDRWLTRPGEQNEEAVVQVFNGTTVAGLAGQTSAELERARFQVLVPANAPPGDYPVTVVYDLRDNPFTSRRLARTLDAELHSGPPPAGVASQADIVVILGADATR